VKIIKRDIDSLNVYYMPNKKFKTIDMAFVFTNKFDPKEINERNFLSEILMESTAKYNNQEKLSLACDNLYGLDKTSNYHAVSNMSITTFMARTINDKYVDDSDVFSHSLDLLIEIIFNPKLFKGKIPKKAITELKEQTEELLLSIKQNKNAYTYYQFMNEYTRNNKDTIAIFPEKRYFNEISAETVTNVYNKMINEDDLQIFIAGDFDHEEMDQLIKNKLHFYKSKTPLEYSRVVEFKTEEKINEVIEKESTGQSRVYIGYKLDFPISKQNAATMALFDEIFGGYEKSKLFSNIREKMQLSYYVYSRYNEDNNLFFVNLETNKQNLQKAVEAVNQELKACKSGDISDSLFNQAKINLTKRLENAMDSQTKLLLHNIIETLKMQESFDLENKIKTIEDIRKEDLIALIQNISIDTIYIYTNED
jgi:predicted Zn-dependent peptidase